VKDRLIAREVAKAAWAAAGTSEQQLADDLAQATDRLRVRTNAVEAAAAMIVTRVADAFAQEIVEHKRQIERLEGLILGFDQYICVNPAATPASVRDIIIGTLSRRIGTPEQRAVWFDAAAKLRADPAMEVVVEDPAPPAPRPNMSHPVPHVAAAQAARRAQESPPEAA
jgi:hypothetical protein